ncbi:glycosyltransferase [Sulfurimonas indica]|uniref:glycosyltransferase n=1 Tax=Sulfurimonas indica TaxID=2508707 RepID=UPI0012657944|nr:glycosyltransferase [Sulfurimonas indica]
MHILLNALGIQDSGGITVLEKVLDECQNSQYNFFIYCNDNENIEKLIKKYKSIENFHFKKMKIKNFFHRLFIENIFFKKVVQQYNIDLAYNFSGSAQFFLHVPQLTKVHNLLFYSKKIDSVYLQKREYLKWLKQIFFKRIVFHAMLRQVKYVEVQSIHVKEAIREFLDISHKEFFIKSDIDITPQSFLEPKVYDFSKKVRFLYIVGPHFEYLHKNFLDFTEAMSVLHNNNLDFEIDVTLTKEQLQSSHLWNKELNYKTNFLGYIDTKKETSKIFRENTILISTSVVETLGLHVIEAIQNGVIAFAPNDSYAKSVYGDDIITYTLFDVSSLVRTIEKLLSLEPNEVQDIIRKNQQYIINNENKKYQNVVDIFKKVENV